MVVKANTLSVFHLLPRVLFFWKHPIRFALPITNLVDWEGQIWLVRCEWMVDGTALKTDVVVMDDYMIFNLPLTSKRSGAQEIRATVEKVLTERTWKTMLLKATPPGHAKPIAVWVNFRTDTQELEISEHRSSDRKAFLKLMESILRPED